jgi:L-iditol 2-dehydrogenase
VGILVAAVAAASGATTVVVAEPAPERRLRSSGLTSATVVPPEEVGADQVFDAFVECSGAAPALRLGLDRLRPAGVAVLVGMGADEVPVPVTLVQVKELVVTGTFRYANTYPDAIRLAASGRVDLDALVDRRFGLDEVEAALSATRLDPSLMKVVVTP